MFICVSVCLQNVLVCYMLRSSVNLRHRLVMLYFVCEFEGCDAVVVFDWTIQEALDDNEMG